MSFAYKSSELSGTNKDNLITLLVGVCIDAFDLYLLLFVMCVMETNKKNTTSISQSFVVVLEGIRSTSNWRFILSKI